MAGRSIESRVSTKRWTRREYHALIEAGVVPPDASLELIEGEIIEVTPQGSRHASTVMRVYDALRQHVGAGYLVRCQLPLSLSEHSEPEPDLAVVEGEIDAFDVAHPTTADLVIEVADASLTYDRSTKASLYAKAGIPEYWIVNLIDRQVEAYTDLGALNESPTGHGYRARRVVDEQSSLRLRGAGGEISVSQLLPRS